MKGCVFGALLCLFAGTAGAQAIDEIGVRVSGNASDGALLAVTGRWLRGDGWFVEAALGHRNEQSTFVSGTGNLTAAFGRYRRLSADGQNVYWRWGLGVGVPKARSDAPGLRRSAATEIRLVTAIGVTQPLGQHWRAGLALQYERQYVDRRLLTTGGELLDRQTRLSDAGLTLALNYRF